jgi:hypothetical protein
VNAYPRRRCVEAIAVVELLLKKRKIVISKSRPLE